MPKLSDIFADRIVERHLALPDRQSQQCGVEYLAHRGEIEKGVGRDRSHTGPIGETEVEKEGAAIDPDCDGSAGAPKLVLNFLRDDLLHFVVGQPIRGVRGRLPTTMQSSKTVTNCM